MVSKRIAFAVYSKEKLSLTCYGPMGIINSYFNLSVENIFIPSTFQCKYV
jgi:hypothetical protein